LSGLAQRRERLGLGGFGFALFGLARFGGFACFTLGGLAHFALQRLARRRFSHRGLAHRRFAFLPRQRLACSGLSHARSGLPLDGVARTGFALLPRQRLPCSGLTRSRVAQGSLPRSRLTRSGFSFRRLTRRGLASSGFTLCGLARGPFGCHAFGERPRLGCDDRRTTLAFGAFGSLLGLASCAFRCGSFLRLAFCALGCSAFGCGAFGQRSGFGCFACLACLAFLGEPPLFSSAQRSFPFEREPRRGLSFQRLGLFAGARCLEQG